MANFLLGNKVTSATQKAMLAKARQMQVKLPATTASLPTLKAGVTRTGATMPYSGIRSMEIPSILQSGFSAEQLVRGLASVEKVQKKIQRVEQDCLYSCYLLPATTPINRYDLFRTPLGQPGQGFLTDMTLLETNLENTGRIPDEYGYAIHSIGCFWDPYVFQGEPDAYAEVGHRCALSYSFLEKEKILGPAVMYPGGGGIQGFSTVANIGICSNGAPGANNLYPLAEPIFLPSGTSFKFSVYVTGAGAAAGTPDDALDNTNPFRFWIRLVGVRAAYISVG